MNDWNGVQFAECIEVRNKGKGKFRFFKVGERYRILDFQPHYDEPLKLLSRTGEHVRMMTNCFRPVEPECYWK